MGPLDKPEDAEGVALESLFLHELKTINEALSLGYKIYYWKTASKKEVDFVLYGNKGLYAFEIKRTNRITKAMFSGLKSFTRDYPEAKAYFVYGGKRYMREGSIEIIPIEDVLNKLPGILSGKKVI
jgi:predicted AAA+ superfamily ATPase